MIADLNVTTLSLLDVESCNIPLTQPQIEKTYIQLFQLSKFESIEVIQCKVSINRFIYYTFAPLNNNERISRIHSGNNCRSM